MTALPPEHKSPILAATLLAVALAPGPASGADPSLRWYTLTTEHFQVHFHDDGEPFARRAAGVAEEAYGRMTQQLGWKQREARIDLVCSDVVDGANGFARTLPYSAITLLAFSPEADTDLGRYDDWLRVLVYHELTHVLHLDQVGPVQDVVNTVLGKVWTPNLAMPAWFIEGIATWAESRFTPLGRAGGAAFEMYLRMAALEGTLPSLSGLTGDPLEPPGGTWRYAFGGAFVSWLAGRYGDDALVRFATAYGRRVMPYALNSLARESFGGQDLPTLFDAWRSDLVDRALVRQAAERKRGLLVGERLTTAGQVHHAPVFAPSGTRFAFKRSDGYEETRIRIADAGGGPPLGEVDSLYRCDGGCGRAVWSPDGSALFVIGGAWVDPHRLYRSLLRYDLTKRPSRPTRITNGIKAREPAIRPDGRAVALVAASWGRTALVEVLVETGQERTLIPFDAGFQLNQPRYLPGGERIIVSAQEPGSWRDLAVREPDGRLRWLTRTPEREIGATLSSDGRTAYYSSDLDGIWNIHALDIESGERWQVTRVLGGAFNPSVSADGGLLLYNGYGAGGHDIYRVALDRSRFSALPPPKADEPPPPRYEPQPVAGLVRPYRAYRSAWPRSWAPALQADQNGLSSVGLTLAGSDAVGLHNWLVSADYSVAAEDASVGAAYSYGGFRPSLNLFFARFPGAGLRFVADEVTYFHQENIYASAGVGLSIPDVRDWLHVSADLTWWWSFDPSPPRRIEHDPGSYPPFATEDEHRIGLRLSWSYDRVDRYALSISDEKGVRLGMTLEVHPELFGNTGDSWSLSFNADGYVPMPWARGHVLALLYKGGIAGGDEDHRGSFSAGGLPEQDLVLDLLNESGVFGIYLRGYEPGALSGSSFHQLSAQYRLPVLGIFRGVGTLPVWFERLTAAVYADMALVYDDEPTADSFAISVGGELALRTELFYAVPFTFRLGYAHALRDPLTDHLYFVMGSQF